MKRLLFSMTIAALCGFGASSLLNGLTERLLAQEPAKNVAVNFLICHHAESLNLEGATREAKAFARGIQDEVFLDDGERFFRISKDGFVQKEDRP